MTPDTPSFRRLFLALCVIWVVLNFDVLRGGGVLPWDAIDQFYPTVYFNAHSLRLGQMPWWNPHIYSGYAQIGDPQGMLFSPLLMAWMVLLREPGPVWFDWGVLLHVLMGGTAMLAMLRRHGANALGSLLGATVFMAGGVAASRLEHTPDVIAYAYVPLVLLALHRFLTRPGVNRGFLLGLAAGAMVTQLVQVTYLFVLVIVACACMGTVRYGRHYQRAERRQWLAGAAIAIAVAAAIGVPQLVFSWAAMSLSNRSVLPLSLATAGSLDLRAFLFLLNPNAFNALRDMHGSPVDIVQAFLYIGAVPTLALYGLRRAWRHAAQRPALIACGVLAGFAVVYMLGTHTPIYPWLYSWLPGLEHFRRPSDAAYLLNLALAFAAGIAASHIDLQSRRELTVLLVVAVCWLAVTSMSMHDRHARPFISVVVAAIALWRLRRPGSDWRASLWLLAVLVADYRSFNLNGTFNEGGNMPARFAKSAAVRYLLESRREGDTLLPTRIVTHNTFTTWDNTGAVVGLHSTQGYNPLRYALYERWYRPRESSNEVVETPPYNALPESKLNDLLGVSHLVLGHRDDLPLVTVPSGYGRVFASKDVDIWRNEHAYPRMLNPIRATLLGIDEAPDIGEFVRTDFRTDLWLTPRDDIDLAAGRAIASNCNGAVQVQTVSATATTIDLHVTASSAGWIAVGDPDYPGWTADVDGTPVHIHRANGMFRAVCVPAGEHRLRFAFHPWVLVAYAWRHRDRS